MASLIDNIELFNPGDYPEQAQKAVEDFNEKLQAINRNLEVTGVLYEALGSSPFALFFDEKGELTSCVWSDLYRKSMGYEDRKAFPDDLEEWFKIVHENDREMVKKALWDSIRDYSGNTDYDVRYRVYARNGELRWNHSVGKARRRPDGTPVLFVGMAMDVTQYTKNYQALQEQYEIMEGLSRDYLNVFMVDVERETARILKLDGYVTEGFGDKSKMEYPYTPFALKYINDRVYAEDQEMMKQAMDIGTVKEKLEQSSEYVRSYRAIAEGEIHFYQFTYIRLHSDSGTDKVIAGFKNIDTVVETAREREALIVLSETDVMTNIFNRRSGEKKSRELIKQHANGMFCIMDVDRFKAINDTFGHSIGDQVLIKVADALKTTFRDKDIVFRLGGDEFAVFAPGVQYAEDGEKMIGRFFETVEKIDIPELNGHKICVSMGAVIFSSAMNMDFESLYRKADANSYEAKKKDGNALIITGEI